MVYPNNEHQIAQGPSQSLLCASDANQASVSEQVFDNVPSRSHSCEPTSGERHMGTRRAACLPPECWYG
jgi:hypothetical protein